jgi:hypothetical protein
VSGPVRDLFPIAPSPYTWPRYEAAIEEIERQGVFTRRTVAAELIASRVGHPYSTANVAIGVLRAAGLVRQMSPLGGKPQVFATVDALLGERASA